MGGRNHATVHAFEYGSNIQPRVQIQKTTI